MTYRKLTYNLSNKAIGGDKLLTDYFKEILDNYIESKTTGRFNKNHEMFKLINYTTTDALNEIVKNMV